MKSEEKTQKITLWKNVVVWLAVILYLPIFIILKYLIWCLSFLIPNGSRIRETLQGLYDEQYVIEAHVTVL